MDMAKPHRTCQVSIQVSCKHLKFRAPFFLKISDTGLVRSTHSMLTSFCFFVGFATHRHPTCSAPPARLLDLRIGPGTVMHRATDGNASKYQPQPNTCGFTPPPRPEKDTSVQTWKRSYTCTRRVVVSALYRWGAISAEIGYVLHTTPAQRGCCHTLPLIFHRSTSSFQRLQFKR